MNIYAIGDIHGEANKLFKLLSLLQNVHSLDLTQDKLVFLGDYVDRGLDSLTVLETIYGLQQLFPANVIALAGNHEYLMLDYEAGEDKWNLWLQNGGRSTLDSFKNRKCPKYLLKWLANMPLYHEEPGFFFSHAPQWKERHRRKPGEPFTRQELIWNYNDDYVKRARVFDNSVVGVCGHIHDVYNNNFHPRLYKNYIFTDAGCGCHPKAPLCAVNVHTREIIYAV